jgi:lysophospholipase L1-like esterase
VIDVTLAEVALPLAWNLRGDASDASFAAEARRSLGLPLPIEPMTSVRDDRRTLLWLGPRSWLFVGSSSIRLWADLEQQFQTQPVIVKRGFGGSRMADCTRYLERLVLPYQPRLVIVYAGDNDLAEGRSPQDVLASFTAFVEGVHEALPRTRIAYLSIKPSPLREALLPKIQEANGLIAQYVAAQPELAYIDIFSKMLDADGHPRKELFSADSLHMNESGYALWKAVIDPFLRLPAPIPMSAPLSPPQSVSASAAASPPAGPSAH